MGDGSEELYSISSDVEEKVNLAFEAEKLPVIVEFRNLLDLMLQRR
jgi:hypothetical protein